jgi:hypothetical protein
MADSTGILSKMGIKAGIATWPTAYAAVDSLIPYTSETIGQGFNRIEDVSLVGSAGRAPSDQGVQALTGQTVHHLDYNNFDALLEGFFGSVSSRVFEYTDDLLAKYFWLEFEKQVSRWRIGAAKITKILIAGEADGVCNITLDWIARDIDYNATAFPSISTPGARTRVRFEDLQFAVDTIAAGPPVVGTDNRKISSFELELDRVLVPDDYATRGTAGDAKYPLEPIPNDFRMNTLKISVPRYNTDAEWVTWKDSNTPIQAIMNFVRGSETFVIDLPDLRVTEGGDPQVGGAERLQFDVTLQAYMPEAGNPLYTDGEVQITIT